MSNNAQIIEMDSYIYYLLPLKKREKNMHVRQRIYEIIEIALPGDVLSKVYDFVMLVTILASIIPLAIKNPPSWMSIIDAIAVALFIIDYLLRWITADIKKSNTSAFWVYPITPMAVIDILSILPSITFLNGSFRLLKVFRLFRSMRVLRVFKLVRYSKSVTMIINVFKKQKESFFTIAGIAIGYILVSALIILNIEPDTFSNYFEAVYWATISLTTVGYGDIYPISTIGKIITMISSVLGIAIVALPAGIITAEIMNELNSDKD